MVCQGGISGKAGKPNRQRVAAVQIAAQAACHGDVIASILPDGIELRFPVELTLDVCRPSRHVCVCGGEIQEEPADAPTIPSLTLRKVGAGETLWSVAKQYRTTCRAIMAVNDLSDEHQVPTDRLLLIPKAR